MIRNKRGFTLIELLVVVIIIAVLTAVAMPMYQHAVLKSRFSKLMPAAKSLAAANEVYYLNNGIYSDNPASLDVGSDTDQLANGTHILLNDDDTVSFVRLSNDEVPHARYVMYQQHSANFANTTMCEAESEDEKATWLCEKGLNGVLVEGGNSGNESGWVAYLLSGSYGSTDTFARSEEGGDTLQCEGEQPPNITASTSGATGTASCVNGQWKYTWTGGRKYDYDYGYCTASFPYGCAGSTFSGRYAVCYGGVENACAGSTFSGNQAYCLGSVENGCAGIIFGSGTNCRGNVANACAGSTFGNGSRCNGNTENGCAGATISGNRAYCFGETTNGCMGAVIQAGAYCDAYNAGGCDGALYGAHPDKDSGLLGSCNDSRGNCPTGVPLTGSWNATTQAYNISGWKGNCCNPAYMVRGECPSGIAVCQ